MTKECIWSIGRQDTLSPGELICQCCFDSMLVDFFCACHYNECANCYDERREGNKPTRWKDDKDHEYNDVGERMYTEARIPIPWKNTGKEYRGDPIADGPTDIKKAMCEAIENGLVELVGTARTLTQLCIEASTANDRRETINPADNIAIAIDIGGTNIKFAYRLRGTDGIEGLGSIKTNQAFWISRDPRGCMYGRNEREKTEWNNTHAVKVICDAIRQRLAQIPRRITCVQEGEGRVRFPLQGRYMHQITFMAVAIAGPIDLESGHILKAFNLGGKRHEGDFAGPLKDYMARQYKVSRSLEVVIMNDSLAPALGLIRNLAYTDIWPMATGVPIGGLPSINRVEFPILCMSVGTSVGIVTITAMAAGTRDRRHMVTLPETWVGEEIQTAKGKTMIWQGLNAKYNTTEEILDRLLREGGALEKLVGLWHKEAYIQGPIRTLVIIGGGSHKMKYMDGFSKEIQGQQNPIKISIPAVHGANQYWGAESLILRGALSYGVSPMVVRVRRVAIMQDLEHAPKEVLLKKGHQGRTRYWPWTGEREVEAGAHWEQWTQYLAQKREREQRERQMAEEKKARKEQKPKEEQRAEEVGEGED